MEATPAAAPAANPLDYASEPRRRMPLYVKIIIALILGVLFGLVLKKEWAEWLNIPPQMILRLLGAIAPPLILFAVIRALMTANVRGRMAGRLFFLLALNTLVAIFLGLLVANVIRPGRHASLSRGEERHLQGNFFLQLLENIPTSLVKPLVENNVIGVIFIAVAFGCAARQLDAWSMCQ